MTFIEVTLVLFILGLLVVFALPKLFSVSSSTHKASVAGTAGAFREAVNGVHMAYLAAKLSGQADNVPGFGNGDVDTNANGWPTDTAGSNTVSSQTTCVNVWNGILMSPPSISRQNQTSVTSDYKAQNSGQSCVYRYQKDTATSRSFTYSATTGVVTLTNP